MNRRQLAREIEILTTVYICMHTYVRMPTCVYVCIYIYIYICMYVCMYICVYVCTGKHASAAAGARNRDSDYSVAPECDRAEGRV